MNTADALWQIVKQYCDTVFMVPGGGAAYLVDSLGKSGLRIVPCLHEQGAGYGAIGYAMTRGGLGVCLTTTGPGATNAVTPCAAAWMDSQPVLFISGQALSSTLVGNTGLRTRGVQEIDIISIVKPITKWAFQVSPKLDDTQYLVWTLICRCLEGRQGPCWLSIPLDVQMEECHV